MLASRASCSVAFPCHASKHRSCPPKCQRRPAGPSSILSKLRREGCLFLTCLALWGLEEKTATPMGSSWSSAPAGAFLLFGENTRVRGRQRSGVSRGSHSKCMLKVKVELHLIGRMVLLAWSCLTMALRSFRKRRVFPNSRPLGLLQLEVLETDRSCKADRSIDRWTNPLTDRWTN